MKLIFSRFIIVIVLLIISSIVSSNVMASEKETLEENVKFREENGLNTDINYVKNVMNSKDKSLQYGVSLTREEVQQVQSLDEKASKISAEIKGIVSEDKFGGMYIDHKVNKIHIGLVDISNNRKLVTSIQNKYGKKFLKFHNSKYSEKYLNELKSDFDKYWTSKKLDIEYTYTQVKNSKIIVGLNDLNLKSELIQKYPSDIFKFEKNETSPLKFEGYRAVDEYRTPYMAGQKLEEHLPNNYVSWCTGAFMYKKGTSAYQVTAGHCFDYGTPVYLGGIKYGTTSAVKFGLDEKADVEAIAIPSIYARDYLWGTTNGNQNYFGGVEYVSGENVGEIVCIFGATTQATSCSNLEQKDRVMTYYDNNGNPIGRFSNMRVSSYTSAGGDSGAPIFNKINSEERRILGVHSGVFTGSDGQQHKVYSHVSQVADALNFTYSDIIFRR